MMHLILDNPLKKHNFRAAFAQFINARACRGIPSEIMTLKISLGGTLFCRQSRNTL